MKQKHRSSFDYRMLTLADEVFLDFDDLPVTTVMRAITSSWSELRTVPTQRPRPEEIVSRARAKLIDLRPGIDLTQVPTPAR